MYNDERLLGRIHINEKTYVVAELDSLLKEYIPCRAGRIPGNVRDSLFLPKDIASSDLINFLFMMEICQGE